MYLDHINEYLPYQSHYKIQLGDAKRSQIKSNYKMYLRLYKNLPVAI